MSMLETFASLKSEAKVAFVIIKSINKYNENIVILLKYNKSCLTCRLSKSCFCL